MNKSISLLLGAGFSVPMGYPTGKELNQHLLNCDGKTFSFHTSGSLIVNTDGSKPNIGFKTSYDFEFDYCRDLIKYFNEKKGYFDYEEFYDFIKEEAKTDPQVKKLAIPYKEQHSDVADLLYAIDNIFIQLISYYLKDGEGNTHYDSAGHIGGAIFPGYTGILNCLKQLVANYIINMHSLNHDLFTERLNYSDWFSGELCDGFEELGSPYYGKLICQKASYLVRLARYTGKYEKRIRLHKLHGSRDYGIYYEPNAGTLTKDNYIKTRWGVGFSEIYKESLKGGKLVYDHCWINYHADFLTGTTSKIERYKEPLLYKKLFELFRANLKEAEMLILVGYGGKDTEINKMILENFDFKNKPCFIIDPTPGDKVNELKVKLNAKLIQKYLEDIKMEDFE